MERAELDAKILAWMREPVWDFSEDRFEKIALELFSFQFRKKFFQFFVIGEHGPVSGI